MRKEHAKININAHPTDALQGIASYGESSPLTASSGAKRKEI